jgi:hypothetical protein
MLSRMIRCISMDSRGMPSLNRISAVFSSDGVDVGRLGHGEDVGVPGDRPVPLVVEAGRTAALGHPPDRGGAAQLGQLLGGTLVV